MHTTPTFPVSLTLGLLTLPFIISCTGPNPEQAAPCCNQPAKAQAPPIAPVPAPVVAIPQEEPRPAKPVLLDEEPRKPLPPAIIVPIHTPEPPSLLTYAKYMNVRSGMTFAEVRNLIGFPGKELSRVDFGDGVTAVYQWEGSGGANMLVTFQRGVVVSKAQAGLR